MCIFRRCWRTFKRCEIGLTENKLCIKRGVAVGGTEWTCWCICQKIEGQTYWLIDQWWIEERSQAVNNMFDIVILKVKDDELDDENCKKLMSLCIKSWKLLHFSARNQDVHAVVCTEFDATNGKLFSNGQLTNHARNYSLQRKISGADAYRFFAKNSAPSSMM